MERVITVINKLWRIVDVYETQARNMIAFDWASLYIPKEEKVAKKEEVVTDEVITEEKEEEILPTNQKTQWKK